MYASSDVVDAIKDLLLVRLELAETGLTADQICEETLLLDATGLALDSVEVLDLLVGVEKRFGLRIRNIDKDFIEATCRSVQSLVNYVLSPRADLAGEKKQTAEY